jgi:hypothetical protein
MKSEHYRTRRSLVPQNSTACHHPGYRGTKADSRQYTMWEEIIMKRWPAVTIALLLIGFTAFSYPYQVFGQTGTGWITLFDGKNLDNWSQIGTANWKLEDGSVVADNGSGFLVSRND